MLKRHPVRTVVLSLALLGGVTFASSSVLAQESEANLHFHRAVQLYGEADYRAALVEFKRAYEIAPHVTVLYNLGQTYYQLQSYAEALTAFERFLAEGGTGHRSEVENAINVLKSRVGKIDVVTSSPGWEISIDDEAIGKTPLAKPAAVSIGRRRITATKAGESTQTRLVEVAAGETMAVRFTGAPSPSEPPSNAVKASSTTTAPEKHEGMSPLLIVGWAGAGALALGAVATGIVASSAASDLEEARRAVPGDRSEIDSQSSRTTTFAILTDVLAGTAIVLGGVSLYFTLRRPSATTGIAPSTLRIGVAGPGRIALVASF